MAERITSTGNERIKRLVKLRDRRHRDKEGVFVVEGDRLFARATGSGLTPTEVYVTDSHRLAGDPDVTIVTDTALDKASYRTRSEGLIAVFPQARLGLRDLRLSPNPFLLVAESIEKPGNLGAMVRTANATGADALITVGGGVDQYNPNALRASTGALFETPVIECQGEELTEYLDSVSIRLLASSPSGTHRLWESDLTGPVALVVGAEDEGLSRAMLDAAASTVTIPMYGSVDSLNASVSLAVLAYEVVRQRS